MNIIPFGPVQKCPITEGIIAIGREKIQEGVQVFIPPPDWTPTDGHQALVMVTVKQIVGEGEDQMAICDDANGQPWGFWL